MLPRTVILLSLVSFLNDAASELITPLLPLFLTLKLGAGPWAVGLIEGLAEATSSLLKILSGHLADRGLRYKPLVVSGYALSNLCRPLIGLAGAWTWVLALRFFDRVGKGLRTAPRDALIALTTPPELLGRAFGLHRALDNAGAIAGPVAAFFLLQLGLPMTQIFLWSAVPGVAVVVLLWLFLKEPPKAPVAKTFQLNWHALDPKLAGLILAGGGLQLTQVPEVFLVLWATGRGLELTWAPLLWAAASAVKTPLALAGGELSDRIGKPKVLLLGWGMRVGVLLALSLAQDGLALTWGLFLGYAAALALTEGPERALVGAYAPKALRATVFGLYHMTVGLAALPGGVLFGSLWQWQGAKVAFSFAAVGTALSAGVFLLCARRAHRLST
jgi:nitrate/nitrite transporter NarK